MFGWFGKKQRPVSKDSASLYMDLAIEIAHDNPSLNKNSGNSALLDPLIHRIVDECDLTLSAATNAAWEMYFASINFIKRKNANPIPIDRMTEPAWAAYQKMYFRDDHD